MRILKILIILLVLVFPFGELLRFDLGNNIRFKPLDLLAGLILLQWVYLMVTKRMSLPEKRWHYFVFPGIGLLALLTNGLWLNPSELAVSGMYLIRWFSYLTIFFVVYLMSRDFKKTIISLLFIDGLIIVILGFIQFFFFSSLKPLYSLGWDDHMYRMFSVFLDPNYTGGFFVLYLLFVGGLLYKLSKEKKVHGEQSLLKLPFRISIKNLRVLLVGVVSLTAIALFLTFSRSTILMFLVGTSVFFFLIGRKKLIAGTIAFIVIFTVLISSRFYIENVNLFRIASTTSRISNYEDALNIINANPLLGVGFNAYRYAKREHNITMEWMKNPSHADAGVDNSFLFVFATTGIVGFGAYAFLWFSLLKRAYVLHKKERNIFALIMISSAAGLFVHAFFINSLFFPAMMVWMWFLNGFMEQN